VKANCGVQFTSKLNGNVCLDHFLFYYSWGWMRMGPLGTPAASGPILPASDIRWWVWSSRWNEDWEGNMKYSEKTYPITALSTINPTLRDVRRNWFVVVEIRPVTAWAEIRVFSFILSAYIKELVQLCRLYDSPVGPADGLERSHEEKICAPTDNRTPVFREVTICSAGWLTPTHTLRYSTLKTHK
jgi:hypothetical protein